MCLQWSLLSLLCAEEKDGFLTNHNLMDAMRHAHVITAVYGPSHFPACLAEEIHLLPDIAHLAESAAHAAAKFSQRLRVVTKSSTELTRHLKFCCG